MNSPTPARPALDDSIYTKRTITHDEAVEIAHRLINSHFNKEPCARASIPARPDYDDDLLILAFIEQQRRADMRGALEEARLELLPAKHRNELSASGKRILTVIDQALARSAP